MSETPAPSLLRIFTQRKMAAMLLLGFASGMPLFLVSRTLQAWMTRDGVDLTSIGLFSLVLLPYSLKFVWAPVIDRYIPPFLGRRRGWILIAQVGLILAIAAMSLHDPERALELLAVNAILIAFLSATQDIAFNAYQVDVLTDREMALGAAIGVLGYRVALILTGGAALVLADHMRWPTVYLIMAGIMAIGIIATLWAPEPELEGTPPLSMYEAIVLPFRDFFRRSGVVRAFMVLLFIVLYKLADYLAGNMATPFLLQAGYSETQIGVVQGGLGLGATIVGTIAGGIVVARIGINKSLWIFGALQLLTNFAYYVLAVSAPANGLLIGAIIIENFVLGMVTAVFVAFLMSMCSKEFSATQFALLTSLMTVSRDVVSAPAGAFAESLGWPAFFLFTIAAGLPGLLLLPFFAPWRADSPIGAATHTGRVEA